VLARGEGLERRVHLLDRGNLRVQQDLNSGREERVGGW
jgi:hypothetical protein